MALIANRTNLWGTENEEPSNKDESSTIEMDDGDQCTPFVLPININTEGILSQCVDLGALASPILGTSTKSGAADELCDACSRIRLSSFFGPHCANHKFHYHLGKVEDIQLRKSCAMCRLISAIHDSAVLRFSGVSSKTPYLCTLQPNERTYDTLKVGDYDGIKICFMPESSSGDVEDVAYAQVIRQCVEDSTSLGKPSSTTAWSKSYNGLRGRSIESPQVDFDLVREWLQLCETSHASTCYGPGLIPRTACKIRLIDVLNRKIVDSTTNERYLALSYVWGSGHQFCLNKQNHGDLRTPHSLKGDDIPTTIEDALDVVARLGERYLWVDRLCILIDDEQDKLEQMSNMDQIYSTAILTIVNANACCSNARIPGVKPDSRQVLQHSEVIRGIRYITSHPDLVSAVRSLKWSGRGWTYQEGFLSSRCLVFTPYQTYFQCKSEVWCEDSYWMGTRKGRKTHKPHIGNPLCHLRNYPATTDPCDFNQYIDAVEGFSIRHLTVETDALWAFTGITKAFQPQFQKGFVWGLPVDNLDAALLWHPLQLSAGLRKGLHAAIIDSHTIRLPFPTWSWVSWRGGVEYMAKCEQEVKGLIELDQPARYAVNSVEPFSSSWRQAPSYVPFKSPQENEKVSFADVVMDERALGFLRFSAASANFSLEVMNLNLAAKRPRRRRNVLKRRKLTKGRKPPRSRRSSKETVNGGWAQCSILADSRKSVGSIWVPLSWLEAHSDKQGEFILLSIRIEAGESETCRDIIRMDPDDPDTEYSDGIKHVDDCEHQSIYNIMLIDWKEGPHCSVANRIGITQIHKDDWNETKATPKLIVLG